MEDPRLEPTPQASCLVDKPRWWTDVTDESWNKVKVQVIGEWEQVVSDSPKLDQQLAEQALAFGHGARIGYNRLDVWGRDLESRLQQDWKWMPKAAERQWDDVRETVKLGWERAKRAKRGNLRGFGFH